MYLSAMMRVLFIFLLLTISPFLYGQQSGYAENGDAKIYYETFGEGAPVLIVNGGPGMNSEGFRSVAKLLSEENKTIIYDQRGTGNSTLTSINSDTVTMDLMVEDIETLRIHLNIDTWIVFGHSFGGILASYYASKHPSSIRGMVLSASGGLDLDLLTYVGQNIDSKLSVTDRKNLREWTQKINRGDTTHYARLQRGMALAPAYLYNKEHIPAIAERLTQGNNTINGLIFRDLQKINYDCKDVLQNFSAPVLIIQGKQDVIIERTAITAHNTFPNSEIVLLDKCGHYGWLDQKDSYLSAVYSFFRRL